MSYSFHQFTKRPTDGKSLMRKATRKMEPKATRPFQTIGEVERLAGIGQSHEERFAFWFQFAHFGDDAFSAGRAELYRRIEAQKAQRETVSK